MPTYRPQPAQIPLVYKVFMVLALPAGFIWGLFH